MIVFDGNLKVGETCLGKIGLQAHLGDGLLHGEGVPCMQLLQLGVFVHYFWLAHGCCSKICFGYWNQQHWWMCVLWEILVLLTAVCWKIFWGVSAPIQLPLNYWLHRKPEWIHLDTMIRFLQRYFATLVDNHVCGYLRFSQKPVSYRYPTFKNQRFAVIGFVEHFHDEVSHF